MTERRHYLIDRMDESPAVNELLCACGAPIDPHCDVSSASIIEAFEEHLASVDIDQLDGWQRRRIEETT